MNTLNDSSEKKTLKKKFPFFQTLSRYFSKFNLSNIGGFSHFEINGIRKFYKVVLLFIKIICSLFVESNRTSIYLRSTERSV